MISRNLIKKLRSIVGKENVWDKPEDILCYSFDATPLPPQKPDLVVRPKNEEEILKIVKLCVEEKIPLIPRGAGTNLSAGVIPVKGGIVLLMTGLNRIIEINPDDLYVEVEAGVVTAKLAQEVEKYNLFYPPDPASMSVSTIGGNIMENAGGLRGLKYGVTKDYVMGITFIDATGERIVSGAKTVKCVSGYNLTGLMISSEGTLGILTRAILKLIPPPQAKKSLLAIYDSFMKASETVAAIIASHILPATLEFLDSFTIKTVVEATKVDLPTDAQALLLIEVDGHPAQVEEEAEKISKICEKYEGKIRVAKDEREKEEIWLARRKALSALARLKPTLILEDITVPRSKIPEIMEKIENIKRKYELTIGTFGHAGDGNLHPTILTDARNKEEMKRVEKAVEELFEAAISVSGTLSGEHGIGLAKLPYLVKEVGESTINFMKRLKKGVDPHGIFNPYKLVKLHEEYNSNNK